MLERSGIVAPVGGVPPSPPLSSGNPIVFGRRELGLGSLVMKTNGDQSRRVMSRARREPLLAPLGEVSASVAIVTVYVSSFVRVNTRSGLRTDPDVSTDAPARARSCRVRRSPPTFIQMSI